MITVQENVELLPYTSFGITAFARYFCSVNREDELLELIHSHLYATSKRLIIGSGTNILFTRDFDGLIIKSALMGIAVINETVETVTVRVAAGESWHDFVLHCVDRNWGGIENLSLIPGTVGAAPIQNIGAYGVEVAEVIDEVETIDATTGEKMAFNRDACGFGYRESAFKSHWKEKKFISSVTLTLTKKNHLYKIDYGAIQDTLKQQGVSSLSVKSISDAVIQIRQSKLPDYHRIGNAGSFFKNPTIPVSHYQILHQSFPSLPSYPIDNQNVKIPAGWLIEQCGWKGKRVRQAGVHPQQALVIVNYGGATGQEILQLSQHIQSSVKDKFDITLVPEVNIQ